MVRRLSRLGLYLALEHTDCPIGSCLRARPTTSPHHHDPRRFCRWANPCRAIPHQTLTIVAMETMERVCYYSVRAMLVLYLTQHLKYTGEGVVQRCQGKRRIMPVPPQTCADAEAVVVYSVFHGLAHTAPLVGGLLSDAWLGNWTTILAFGCVYLVGTMVLGGTAFHTDTGAARQGMAAGLTLMAIGTGGIKPCVSAFGASQVEAAATKTGADVEGARSTYFSLFYWGVNLGSTVSFLFIPVLRHHAGFGWAFLTAGFTLVVSLALFAVPRYVHASPSWTKSAWATVARVVHACCLRGCGRPPRQATTTHSSLPHSDSSDGIQPRVSEVVTWLQPMWGRTCFALLTGNHASPSELVFAHLPMMYTPPLPFQLPTSCAVGPPHAHLVAFSLTGEPMHRHATTQGLAAAPPPLTYMPHADGGGGVRCVAE